MSIYNPHIKTKSHILLLIPVCIFGRTKIIETIVTVVYKRHLALGFHHTLFYLWFSLGTTNYVFKLILNVCNNMCIVYSNYFVMTEWSNKIWTTDAHFYTGLHLSNTWKDKQKLRTIHSDFCMLLLLLVFMEHPWYPL